MIIIVTLAKSPDSASESSSGSVAPRSHVEIPKRARDALAAERYFVAARILHEHLTSTADSSAEVILATARADAGWQNWRGVRALLAGRSWLDDYEKGAGRELLGRAEFRAGDAAAADSSYALYLDRKDLTAGERALATVRRAFAAARVPQRDATPLFDSAATQLPSIAGWLRISAAEAAARNGDTAAVRKQLASVDAQLTAAFAWRVPIDALLKARDTARAAAVAEQTMRSATTAARRAEAASLAGTLLLQLSDTARARAAFQTAIDQNTSGSATGQAARALLSLGATGDAQRTLGRALLRAGDAARAADALAPFLDAPDALPLRLELARAQFRAGQYPQVVRTLEPVVRDTARSSAAAEAAYLSARSEYRAGQESAARASFAAVGERFANTTTAADALFFIGDLAHDAGALDTARVYYARAIAAAPRSERAALARMRLGIIAYTAKDYATAASIFDEYRSVAPTGSHRAQANYWSGKAHEALGEHAVARARWQDARNAEMLSYYSGRAAQQLRASLWSKPLAASPERVAPGAAATQALQKIDLLRELNFDDAVRYEISRLVESLRGNTAALYTLAEQLIERGYTTTAIGIGQQIARNATLNPRLLRILYPFPYRTIVAADAEERDLDIYLVAGLIRQESQFLAQAISPAGAVGLMQVMPGTGRELGRAVGVDRFDARMLEIPDVNVALGTAFLADLMKQSSNKVPAVLAAYNAGPTRLERWREFPEFRDMELFTERVPYDETRDYVRIVQQNARIYRALYGDK